MKDGKYFDIFEGNAFSRYIYIYISNYPHKHRETNARKSPKNLSPLLHDWKNDR